ncbi:ribosomal RNA small subunit methyltransferase A [candidate division WWE3 bacterium CG10_big_fil_rev_8_21_14_0_10_32_10]|uniref:Ribosomal RNA small subunit methyltransferase A n=1 Tax=candidate division WWE3 bacterium CG10_big_fil_rev_8_21_14_0_10_32_10 TaxID=1975090 RepID=A0A2H0RB29_UNCKA|nr:MAG: ribosomal RNA small subunit methyltransferase A [candidate division WWE3 bacterium CG10_big_fil_rev_8_21_14_0_10_32_10]
MKSQLGQNFLINKNDINDFIEFCNLEMQDNVLEIGVGEGAITKYIVPRVNKFIGVEVDIDLINKIYKLQNPNYKLQIINGDFLKLNLSKLIKKEKINKIIGAIPYYISSPIIHKILKESTEPLKYVYLITQKEFAKKVVSKANKKSYFTNLIGKYGKIKPGGLIKNTSFSPIPKVDSYSFGIEFTKYPKEASNVVKWSRYLHFIFSNPRKKINKKFNKNIFDKLKIDSNKRPEDLTQEEVLKLYKEQKV